MVVLALLACIAVGVVACVRVARRRRVAAERTPATTQTETHLPTKESDNATDAIDRNDSLKPNDAPPTENQSDALQVAIDESGDRAGGGTSPSVEAGDGEDRPIGKQTQTPFQKRTRVPPEKRGGQPRKEVPEAKQEPAKVASVRPFRTEIICWKREQEWILALEIPDSRRTPGILVLQGGIPLMKDEFQEDCWRLTGMRGEIAVRDNEKDEFSVALGNEDYLLFKLNGSSLNEGRQVGHVSSGSYLVIAPNGLERDERLAGAAQVVPEPVCLEGYLAHFFELSDGLSANIAFRDRSGKPLIITSRGPRFHLVGYRVFDASENLGPLFGGSLPRVCVSDGSWENVGVMVIGEEGRGKGKWRMPLNPNPSVAEQELPIEIVRRNAGWYFVRFYGLRSELIDSLDFRFVAGLHGITVHDVSPLPSTEGHKQSIIDFDHEQGCQVEPFMPHCEDLMIERQTERTTGIIPASSEFDRTHWLVGGVNSPEVHVTVLLERIWWVFGDEHQSDLVWQDRCLPCARNDFMATSNKMIVLKLPQPGWAESVRVGFTEANARQCRTRGNDPTLTIPLRDFGDSPEMRMVGVIPFKLYMSLAGTTCEIPLCTLVVKAACKFDKFTGVSEDELFCHVGSLHLPEFFRSLTLGEFREDEPDLPVKIYVCGHCGRYVSTSDVRNPTNEILTHIESCPVVRDQKLHGSSKYRFRVVQDIDEICENIKLNLPKMQRCKLCSCRFKNADPETLLAHLRSKHKSSCFELQ